MYAVIELKGHQYIVQQGDQIKVDNIDAKEGDNISVDSVLMVFDEQGEKVEVGAPYIKAKVDCKVVENKKGDKVKVVKFKRKNRYERNKGFRPHLTVLNVENIKLND